MTDTPNPAPENTPGPNPNPTPNPDPQPWYAGADNETIGYLQNRGLDKQDAKAVAFASIKAHREAEKMIGGRAEDMLRLPKDGNDPAWRSVWNRLGVPTEAKQYDFSEVKFSDDTPLNDDFSAFLQKTFHENNVPKLAASGVARDVVKYLEKLGGSNDADRAAKLAVEQDTLKKEWSFNFNQNKIVAENAARALGVTEDELNSLEGVVGYARVMEMFRSVGEKIGEDRFVRGPNGGRPGPMTVQQASEQLDGLKADKVWREKLENGDTEAKRQFHQLTELIASGL